MFLPATSRAPPRPPFHRNRRSWQSDRLAFWLPPGHRGRQWRNRGDVNGFHGTWKSHPWQSAGFDTQAVRFDPAADTNNWVDCGSGTVVNQPDEYTLAAWFKVNSAGSYPSIFHINFNYGTFTSAIAFEGSVVIGLHNDGTHSAGSNTAITVGKWHHFAYTVVNSGPTTKSYLDGVDVTSTKSTGGWNVANTVVGQGWSSEEFNGWVPMVMAWTYVLEPAQVKELVDPRTRLDLIEPGGSKFYFVPAAAGPDHTQAVSGSLTPAGALSKEPQVGLAGSITPAGADTKQVNTAMSGSITGSGALTAGADFLQAVAGSITGSGALLKRAKTSVAGSLTPAGAATAKAKKVLGGSITPASTALGRKTHTSLSGTITASGQRFAKFFADLLTGSITGSGTASGQIVIPPEGNKLAAWMRRRRKAP